MGQSLPPAPMPRKAYPVRSSCIYCRSHSPLLSHSFSCACSSSSYFPSRGLFSYPCVAALFPVVFPLFICVVKFLPAVHVCAWEYFLNCLAAFLGRRGGWFRGDAGFLYLTFVSLTWCHEQWEMNLIRGWKTDVQLQLSFWNRQNFHLDYS